MATELDIIPVPTLSTEGWVTSLAEKADKLLTYFFTTDKDQSHLYTGTVSMQWLIQRYQNSMSDLALETQNALQGYLSRYYPIALVDVRTSEDEPDDDKKATKVSLYIYAQVTEGGREHSIGKLVTEIDGDSFKVFNLNNTGNTSE